MEQSIDSNKKPEFAAGIDPAFIPLPGLTAAAGPRKAEPEAEAGPETDPELDEAPEASEKADAAAPGADAGADAEAEAGTEAEAEEKEAGEGPVFEVSDRRGSIRVAAEGITFRLDDQEAEFGWDEIGAVEITPARFGRRLTVTVHLPGPRWFNAEVEAESRARLKEWPAELDAVLDAYFEES
ncbi:hypothetical protein RM717_07745 [Streptomyces griseus]|uniref:Uncharacterized protein n=1 Tax=Streptomyces stephensoniae TaxID=3375367 RepID=A0ABU2VZ95_9ACTN|nr:hypothetical protein [Streptomyces griseus]MDT0490396.1 hypothetical protein [Streptomyces griseus]